MKLTDTQLVILSAASQRPDRAVLPLPVDMEDAAGAKALRLLLKKKLVTEAVAEAGANASAVHRTDKHGARYVLVVSNRGLGVLGVEPETPAADDGPTVDATAATHRAAPGRAKKGGGVAKGAPKKSGRGAQRRPKSGGGLAARGPREGTKQAKLIAMLRRPEGATVAQVAKATGWQHHTVRGAIAGALKKKLGLKITTDKNEAGARVYRIAG